MRACILFSAHDTYPKPGRRTWRLWNLAAGTDLSWGAFDAMSTALGIMPVEVEGPEEVVYDVPHAERCVVLL